MGRSKIRGNGGRLRDAIEASLTLESCCDDWVTSASSDITGPGKAGSATFAREK